MDPFRLSTLHRDTDIVVILQSVRGAIRTNTLWDFDPNTLVVDQDRGWRWTGVRENVMNVMMWPATPEKKPYEMQQVGFHAKKILYTCRPIYIMVKEVEVDYLLNAFSVKTTLLQEGIYSGWWLSKILP